MNNPKIKRDLSPHDIAVQTLLDDYRITFSIELIGPTMRDTWRCDAWRATLGGYVFDYFTGIGHRTKPKHDYMSPQPVRPTSADVLYALMRDAQAIDQSFHDWCSEYGGDTDSRKAEATYMACCEIGAKLRKLFTHEQRQALSETLEDM